MNNVPVGAFWQTPLDELERQLGASSNGLSSTEADARLLRYGANTLDSRQKYSFLLKVLSRFRNPLVLILLVAAVISGLTGDVASLGIISTMVLLSVLLDSVQEYRAEQAAEQLKVSVALKEQVLRDGREITIRADQLVPGDVVLLAAGDLVPADGRLLEARDFFVNEGLLTGESYPTEKRVAAEGTANVDVAQAETPPSWGHPSSAAQPSSFYARQVTLLSSARSAPLYATHRRPPRWSEAFTSSAF